MMTQRSQPPVVSVVVPCFNRAHLIARTVAAVQAQTLENWELLIVDDASTDDMAGTLQPLMRADPRIRLVRLPENRGAAAARNVGVALAAGRFVAFLDSDDSWRPQKLERQLAATIESSDPETTLCATRTVVVLSETRRIIRPLAPPAPGRSFGEFLYIDGGFVQPSSLFLSRALARKVPFREHLRQTEDHLFFLELGALGASYVLVPEPLTVWDNVERPGRISTGDTLAKWQGIVAAFRAEAAAIVPEHVLLAAEARFLTAHLWKVSPIASIALLWRAYHCAALPARQTLRLLVRNALPTTTYDVLRHGLNGVRSAPGGAATSTACAATSAAVPDPTHLWHRCRRTGYI